jgi:sugar phosphate isomerase/epimerase
MGSLSFQKVSAGIPKDLDDRLTDEEIQQVRLKLDAAGVRLLTYYFHQIPGDAAGCRKIFEFGRKLGIETFISEPLPESLDTIEGLCNEYGINLAIHNHGKDLSPNYWNPEGVLKACRNRGKRIGACGDMGYWMRSGIDPIEAVRLLGDRTMALDLHDLDARSPEGHDVPWGTGAGETERFLQELHKLGIRPILISLEYSYNFLDSLGEMARCADFFHQAALKMR